MKPSEKVLEIIYKMQKDLDFYEQENIELKKQISILRQETEWINPNQITLDKASYSSYEIIDALNKAKAYEGLMSMKLGTIMDTFIQILENKHHSQRKR